ncbi:MAG: phenylalanine--tRNA ligase subunit alpha, partial [Gemmatimonadetes bacterium]|nr:phenylalanine--tRNA ligase subunit alpha [Gemmatimonadota bacterium]
MSDGPSLIRDLDALEQEALEATADATDPDDLEAVRIRFLGRKDGRISGVLRGLGTLDPAERPAVGAAANRVKGAVSAALDARAASLTAESGPDSALDLSLPGRRAWVGGKHPITLVLDEIWEVFRSMGFTRARGPEAETEWYNFEALNTPLDHPAADEQDTLYLEDSVLLRSHTSPVQIRTLQNH